MLIERGSSTLLLLLLALGTASPGAAAKPKVLYFESEPRWEMKFLRRALDESPELQLVTLARLGAERWGRFGVDSRQELRGGFPTTRPELARYRLVVLGSPQASTLSPTQHRLLVEHVRSGGALLLLGGDPSSTGDEWRDTPLGEILPVLFEEEERGTAGLIEVELFATPDGVDEPALDLGGEVLGGLTNLPKLQIPLRTAHLAADADVLVSAHAPEGIEPILVVRTEGRGRIAVWRPSNTWKWQMEMPLEDSTHEVFFRNLFSWLLDTTANAPEAEHRTPRRD